MAETLNLKKLKIVPEDELVYKSENNAFVKQILELLIAKDKKHDQKLNALSQAFQNLMAELRKEVDGAFVESRVKKIESDFLAKVKSIDERMAKVRDGKPGKPGLLGRPGLPGMNGSPDNSVQVRDKLEKLANDERLDISAIKGIEKIKEELEKKIASVSKFKSANYGRTMSRFITEVPTGSVNSSNKDFYLSGVPAPGSLILQVNGQIQRPGSSNEYTIADKKITFTDSNKPQTGDTLYAFYTKI